jgi:hypothetical protein
VFNAERGWWEFNITPGEFSETQKIDCQNPEIGYPEIPAEDIPTTPNVFVVEVHAETNSIGAYDDAHPGSVIWRNHVQQGIPGPNEKPDVVRRGKMINYLKSLGVPANEAAALVIAGQTAGQIGANIAAYASTRPKGNSGGKGNGNGK